jgi:hypothetical protein
MKGEHMNFATEHGRTRWAVTDSLGMTEAS